MQTYNRMTDLLNSLPTGNPLGINFEIQTAIMRAWGKIHGYQDEERSFTLYPTIMASVSGGSDSDIVIDLIERIGYPFGNVRYVFFDTGLEFAATKRHLSFLEEKYGISIERRRAKTPVPVGVKKCGQPFLNKRASQYIMRLQKHGFRFRDAPFEKLYAEYPRCKAALMWWCNLWGENSRVNIKRNKWLKEFLIEHPPTFPISDRCCDGAKKATAYEAEKEIRPDLTVQGVRKSEGGARATSFKSCFTRVCGGADTLRPIFWFKNEDKAVYDRVFNITHSDCYLVYGLRRTGCSCCPFGLDFEDELEAAKRYEPALYKAAVQVFGESYEYTRLYRAYAQMRNEEAKRGRRGDVDSG